MRSILALSALLGLSMASPLRTEHVRRNGLAPLYEPPTPFSAQSGDGHLIQDSYIVVLHSDANAAGHIDWLQEAHSQDSDFRALSSEPAFAGLKHEYAIGSLNGYSGSFSPEVLRSIRSRQEVAYVERDSLVYTQEIEKGAPWGLARMSHRKPLGFSTFNKYLYDGHGGEGVTAYVIDTGVNIGHVELEGRAQWGKTIPLNDQDVDANGHGSHVAGTIASRKYGVAKKAQIVAVKVLGSNGSGTMSDVVGGVDWATKHASKEAKAARAAGNKAYKGAVANMSLGGGKSVALDEAVNAAVDTGLHFAVAAGNDNRDACTFSPAAASGPITVGASAISDARAYFSNHGKCVDVFAPGLNILSIWNTGNTSINTISGTSMASPGIAGLVAYFLSLYPTQFTPSEADFLAAGFASPFETRRTHQLVFDYVKGKLGYEVVASKGKLPAFLPPQVLKKSLERIATKGVLTNLPEETVNLLAFNNFTDSSL